MKIKKIIHACILCLLTFAIVGIPMWNILKADGELVGKAENDSGYKEAPTTECPSCKNTIPDNTQWYLDSQTGTQLTASVEIDGEVFTASVITTPLETGSIESPLNKKGNGTLDTNKNYKPSVDSYLNDTKNGVVVDGHLNAENLGTKAIIAAAEKSGKCSGADCLTLIEKNIFNSANSEGKALDDYLDLTYQPMLTVCPDGNCYSKHMVTAVEASNMSGIKDVGAAAADATKAGTNTSYSSVNKGDAGTGTYDAIGKLDIPKDPPPTIKPPGYNPPERIPGTPPEDVDVPEIEKDELPPFQSSGGGCGENYHEVYSEWGDAIDSCGLSHWIIETETTVIVSGNAGTVFAGQSFDWGGASSTSHVSVYPSDGNELTSTIERNAAEIQQIRQQLEYLEAEMNSAQEYADSFDCDCTPEDCEDCVTVKTGCDLNGENCTGEKEECTTKSNCTVETCDWVEQCETDKAAAEQAASEAEEAYNTYKSETEGQLNDLEERRVELEGCAEQYNTATGKTDTANNTATVSEPTLSIGGTEQSGGSMVAVNKGTGTGSTSNGNNTISISNGNFFIPSSMSSGTTGILSQSVTMPSGFVLDIVCSVDTENAFMDDGGSTNRSNINLIYRPISLTEPFPNNRKTLSSWSDSLVVDSIIYNNRGVKDYDVYNLTPMYDITLTPSDIKKIRSYNKKNSYNDFTLSCTRGLYCRSSFLKDYIYNTIDIGNSCGMNSDWYACDTNSSISDVKEDLFRYLR